MSEKAKKRRKIPLCAFVAASVALGVAAAEVVRRLGLTALRLRVAVRLVAAGLATAPIHAPSRVAVAPARACGGYVSPSS